MKNQTSALLMAAFAATTLFSACKNNDDPKPAEQELITTAKISLVGPGGGTFTYKVQNGFNATTPGTVQVDTIKLVQNAFYGVSVQILNEAVTPAEDITEEVVEEAADHLFLYVSTPATGAGSVRFYNGSLDSAGKPLNLIGTLSTGAAGSGKLDLFLLHEPTDKTATSPAAAGGETDAHAIFPVLIQ